MTFAKVGGVNVLWLQNIIGEEYTFTSQLCHLNSTILSGFADGTPERSVHGEEEDLPRMRMCEPRCAERHGQITVYQ